jgi:hypothetical protein
LRLKAFQPTSYPINSWVTQGEAVKTTKTLTSIFASMIFTLVFAQQAKAMVMPAGTFVAVECGNQAAGAIEATGLNIAQVCIGQISGDENQPAVPGVAFRLSDGAEKIFQVTETSNLLIAFQNGQTKSLFHLVSKEGEQTVMKVMRAKGNGIESVSGELDGIGYFVPSFAPVFVIQ